MREEFEDIVHQKKNLNLRIPKPYLWVLAAFAIVLFFVFKEAALYLIFLGLTAVIIYYSKLYHFPIDISPLFFLEIVITRYYGMQYTLLYVFFGYIIPKTFAGTNMKFDSYAFIAISMLANLFVLMFPNMDLMMVGFITSIVQYFLGVLFSLTMRPLFLAIADGIANVTNNILWFFIFSDFIVWLMR
jgi:hypothetical protein